MCVETDTGFVKFSHIYISESCLICTWINVYITINLSLLQLLAFRVKTTILY